MHNKSKKCAKLKLEILEVSTDSLTRKYFKLLKYVNLVLINSIKYTERCSAGNSWKWYVFIPLERTDRYMYIWIARMSILL